MPSGTIRLGAPSTSANALVMTGNCFAAWTRAQAIRWVYETFFGASAALSALRRWSSVVTATSRKLVAVGTARLAVMLATNLAAAPLNGWEPPAIGNRE